MANDARTTRSGVDVTDNAVSHAMMERACGAFLASLARLKVIVARTTTIDWWVPSANALEAAAINWRQL